jgi:bla regulator protein BlaR1
MHMLEFVAGWAIRSSLLILSGGLLVWALRTRDASIKHVAWTAMLLGSLAIPFLSAVLPKLPLLMAHADARSVVATTPAFSPTPVKSRDWEASDPQLAPAPKPFDWMGAAAMLYSLIAAVSLLRLCVGLVLSRRLLRGSRETEISGVRESDRVGAPVTLGIVQPAVILPEDWREWDRVKLDAVLAHERSHIERWDPAVQLLSAVHRSLLWVSPLSWMLDRWIVRAAEEASDDAAVAATADPATYAELLLEFVARRATPLGIGMARYGRPDKRIDRILDATSISRGVTRWSLAAILILACPLAYVAAAASPQSERAMQFPALPAPPVAPATVLVAQPQAPPPPRPPQAQPAPAPPPTFDAVSIKSLPPGNGKGRGPGPGGDVCRSLKYTTGMVAGSATASTLIQEAYGLSPHQVSGGPDWLASDRFCLEAKSAEPAEKDQLRLMLQSMLADRFKLMLHHETKEMPVYVMTVAKKGLLYEVKRGGPPGINAQDLKAAGYEFHHQLDGALAGTLASRDSMRGFADALSRTPFVDRPVLDNTGLTGTYLLLVQWGENEDFLRAAQEQFGLKFESQRAPLPAVVVDSIEGPSQN